MPIYFETSPNKELTHDEVGELSDELLDLCIEHMKKKFGEGKVPASILIFVGSGMNHCAGATMPPNVAGQAMKDAGEAMLADPKFNNADEAVPLQPRLFN